MSASPFKPGIVFEGKNFRIVQTAEKWGPAAYSVEKPGTPDALGAPSWVRTSVGELDNSQQTELVSAAILGWRPPRP